MPLLVAVIVSVSVALAVVLFLNIRQVFVSNCDLPLTVDWIDALSAERYLPMLRLLDGRDLELLRTQPGYTPVMGRVLRRQRCQIFYGYLRSLTADFQRVCTATKLLMLHSATDRPDLASVLVQNQVLFVARLVEVKLAVCFYRYGLCKVNVAALVRVFDTTQSELRTLVPSCALAL
jgi:hypothetical protein